MNRWVVKYSPQIVAQAQRRKRPTLGSWRADEAEPIWLVRRGAGKLIEVLQIKYLNNILEQDRRFIKRVAKHRLGFPVHSAFEAFAKLARSISTSRNKAAF